jgi:RNAse (barnase) inhibitor barstar
MTNGASDYYSNLCHRCGDSHRSRDCTDLDKLYKYISEIEKELKIKKAQVRNLQGDLEQVQLEMKIPYGVRLKQLKKMIKPIRRRNEICLLFLR